jgi:hypothetical protein
MGAVLSFGAALFGLAAIFWLLKGVRNHEFPFPARGPRTYWLRRTEHPAYYWSVVSFVVFDIIICFWLAIVLAAGCSTLARPGCKL